MTVEVEASDAAMASPTSSSGTGPESLRLSEIESAHLCPAGRMKMEELFRQWLNVDGTKEMIQNMVTDLRQGKELNLDALLATVSVVGSGGDSPSRSPKRPPNYQQFGLLSPGSAGSPSARRRHQHLVSLFGDELHNAAAAVIAAEAEAAKASEETETAATDDVDMTAGDSEAASDDNESNAPVENPKEPALPEQEESAPAPPSDADENMEEEQDGAPKVDESATVETDHPMADEALKQVEIPRFYTPGESRRGRLRGLSTDAMARKASDIEARFREFPEGMKVEDFVAITKDLCGFPSFFNAPFFRRILATCGAAGETTPKPPSSPAAEDSSSPTGADEGAVLQRITKDMFQSYWMREMAPCDSVERFFRVVRDLARFYSMKRGLRANGRCCCAVC
ncbi:hypothetical protein P3T76_015907 [Phytophthora citrophthora]|uniref:Uncharacterized protein n=1 Tax=Phytophthora citrophthora TaxID=4793 RepID=A0AAD9FYG5_9STRA|nr:hypothetical protein P3T76_015907 [Phytophthora citrophthora]